MIRLIFGILLLWPTVIGKPTGDAKQSDKHTSSMDPCMDLTDDCVALVAKGICQTDSSHLCALSCYHCLPEADNINYQPNRNIAGVDTKAPPNKWPGPFPPEVDKKPFPTPDAGQHKIKKQQLDPDSREDHFPHMDFGSIRPVQQENNHGQVPANPIPPPIHNPDQERPTPLKLNDRIPIYEPDENIPFPRSEDDQFIYPRPKDDKVKSKLTRRKRQINHPLKKDKVTQIRDPNDPFPYEHRDPDAHFPPPMATKKQIYPTPNEVFPYQTPGGQIPLSRGPLNPIPLRPYDSENPFPWDPLGHRPGHIPIPGQIPNAGIPDDDYDSLWHGPDDEFPFPHRDPSDRRPFPHYDPRDQLPIPHYDPRDQIPRPHQNPASNEVNDKKPNDIKKSPDDKKQPLSNPDADIFKLSKIDNSNQLDQKRQKRQVPILKQLNPYPPKSSSEEIPEPYPINLPPRHTGPNHQLPTHSRRHRPRKPRNGDRGKKGTDNSLESASVFPLSGEDLKRRDIVENPIDDYPDVITDITNHQHPGAKKQRRQTNDEGIHEVLYDDYYVSPDGYDPTQVSQKQLDEPLKKDQFPYPDKELSHKGKPQLPDPLRLPRDITHKLDSDDQWQKGGFPLPDSIEIDRQRIDPNENDHLEKVQSDQYPYPDSKAHMKQLQMPYNPMMGGLGQNPYAAMNPYLNPYSMMNPYSPQSPFSPMNPSNPLNPSNVLNPLNPANPFHSPFGIYQNDKKHPNTEGGEQRTGKKTNNQGKREKTTGHDSKSTGNLPASSAHQIQSPDDIKNPKEGPNNFQKHPKNIKAKLDDQKPHPSIPVPDEVPSVPSRINKEELHRVPRPTPAKPLPDPDDFNPFDP